MHFHGAISGQHYHGDGAVPDFDVVEAVFAGTDGADTLAGACRTTTVSAAFIATDGADALTGVVQTVASSETVSHYHGPSPIPGAHVHWNGSYDELTFGVNAAFVGTESADTVASTAWHGVLGAVVPGEDIEFADGAALLYNEVISQGLEANYVWLQVLSISAGSIIVFDDSSFVFTGPSGTHTLTYNLYVDGVLQAGTGTATLIIPDSTAVIVMTEGSDTLIAESIRQSGDFGIEFTLTGNLTVLNTGTLSIEGVIDMQFSLSMRQVTTTVPIVLTSNPNRTYADNDRVRRGRLPQ